MATLTNIRPRPNALSPAVRLGLGGLALLAGAGLGLAASLGISQTMLVLGLFAPFVLLVMLAKPDWSAIVYLVLVYTDLLSILVRYHDMPPLARFAGIAVLGSVLGYRLYVQKRPFVGDQMTLWLLAYGAMVALGLLYARSTDLVMSNVIEFVRAFFTYIVVINVITSSARLHVALYSILGAGTVLATLTIFQTVTGQFDDEFGGLAQYRVSDIAGTTEGARPGGTIGDANYYGQLLLIMVPVGIYLALKGQSKRARWAGAMSTAILTTAVVLTYSRGDAIALGAVFLAAIIFKRPPAKYLVLGAVALLLALPFLPSNYLERMSTVVDVLQGNQKTILTEDSIRGRAGATQAAVEMFLDHPFFGVGRENYPLYQLDYLAGTGYVRVAKGIPPHNLYLEIAAEHGVMGLVVVGGLLVAVWFAALEARRRFRSAGMSREADLSIWLVIVLIGYLVTSVSLHGAFLYVLWLIVSFITAARQISRAAIPLTAILPASHRVARPAATRPAVEVPARVGATRHAAGTRGAGALRGAAGRLFSPTERTLGRHDHDRVATTSPGPGDMSGTVRSLIPQPQPQPEPEAKPYESEVWLGAASAALQRGDVNVARAMVEIALERDPYNGAAWTMSGKVARAEARGAVAADQSGDVVEEAARSAFEAVSDGGAAASDLPRHEVSERMYGFWQDHGGAAIFGYPISPRFAEVDRAGSIIEVQYFERARLEHHPSRTGSGYEITAGMLGMEVPRRGSVALRLPPGLEGEQVIFTASGKPMPSPRKFFAFWEAHGGPAIFGYPISPVLLDADTHDEVIAVQYFEKARFEFHPRLTATPYEVQLTHLGAQVFAAHYGNDDRPPATVSTSN